MDYLEEEISKRVANNEERSICLLNLTPEIIDRLFNAYQTDLSRKVDFVNEFERLKIRWALVDDKSEITRHSLHATNRDLYSDSCHTTLYS